MRRSPRVGDRPIKHHVEDRLVPAAKEVPVPVDGPRRWRSTLDRTGSEQRAKVIEGHHGYRLLGHPRRLHPSHRVGVADALVVGPSVELLERPVPVRRGGGLPALELVGDERLDRPPVGLHGVHPGLEAGQQPQRLEVALDRLLGLVLGPEVAGLVRHEILINSHVS